MVRWNVVGRLLIIAALLVVPAAVTAQEAMISGTISDTTGGVLPGATMTAIYDATGNTSFSRLDLRIQRRFALGSRVALDGMVEVFNVFNRANYGSWVTNERNARYGQPSDSNNIAYKPRLLQLGFRAAF